MKLKKANALFGLLTILLLLVHAGYQMIAYIQFCYNPGVTKILGYLILAALLVHMALGMSIMMFSKDSAEVRYPKENKSVILQRGSAIAILVLVFAHLNAYEILMSHAGGIGSFVLVMLLQALFFGSIFTHIATSFSKAFITLGLLSSIKTKRYIDTVLWILLAAAFVFILLVMGKTYYALWSRPAL